MSQTSASPPTLDVSNVTVRFGGLTALDGVTLTADAGERTVIIGPNGAGKTTLFNVIGGNIKPRTGTVHVHGTDITNRSPNRIRHRGVARAFQTASVFPSLTVRENIWMGQLFDNRIRWNPATRARAHSFNEQVAETARLIGLQDQLEVIADHLSHADQKLLDIGVALVGSPSLLLLDEPTQGVSPDEVSRITTVIREAMGEIAVVVIEHDIATVMRVATRVVVLDRGAVIAEGPLSEVSENPEVQNVYLGQELSDLVRE